MCANLYSTNRPFVHDGHSYHSGYVFPFLLIVTRSLVKRRCLLYVINKCTHSDLNLTGNATCVGHCTIQASVMTECAKSSFE